MKLNKMNRKAFVTGVMADVPDGKFEDQIHNLVRSEMTAKLPVELRKLADDPEKSQYLHTANCSFGWGESISSMQVYGKHNLNNLGQVCDNLSSQGAAKLRTLWAAFKAEQEARQELRQKLEGAIASVTTAKQTLELFPEFAKYLPVESAKGTMLPAVINIVPDLIKAGWPKDKKAVKVKVAK